MARLRSADRLLESPVVYGLWQAPFATQKFAPVAQYLGLSGTGRVLDVGCGPGTNRKHFTGQGYLGIDINPRYIRRAQARMGGSYIVADVSDVPLSDNASFDLILVNSLLHHIPTPQVEILLDRLARLLSPNGTIHVLDLVLPERGAAARLLAHLDRGDYPRRRATWEALLSRRFRPERIEGYSIDLLGLPLWHMIYFRGRT